MRIVFKSIIIMITGITFSTCIDPYVPELSGYESLLVVDGLITDANNSYSVKLTKTFQNQSSVPEPVNDADLSISDDTGRKYYLFYMRNGIYQTDSLAFRGVIGRTYVLHILTHEGNEYSSEPCILQSVPEIDSVYFAKDQKLLENGTDLRQGVSIYLDSKEGDFNRYYRWAFEETWKFRVPDPQKYNYDMASGALYPIHDLKEFCWKTRKSDEILINSVLPGQPALIKKEPIYFIASDISDRLLIQYSILVKQYSISGKEYEFWNNLKNVNESGGDIFAKQPYTVVGNVKNVKNPKERVLGYFQVSAVAQKRANLPFSKIIKMKLPFYHYNSCFRIEAAPSDFMTPYGPSVTWADVYRMFCVESDYCFVEPLYIEGTNVLDKMIFSTPECANCEFTGSSKKPVFWIDLN